jgi:hypothetical protein
MRRKAGCPTSPRAAPGSARGRSRSGPSPRPGRRSSAGRRRGR